MAFLYISLHIMNYKKSPRRITALISVSLRVLLPGSGRRSRFRDRPLLMLTGVMAEV
jgi:hypothetical protein